jgi:hypothetical protein
MKTQTKTTSRVQACNPHCHHTKTTLSLILPTAASLLHRYCMIPLIYGPYTDRIESKKYISCLYVSVLPPYLLYRLVTHFIPLSLRHGSLPVCTVPYEYRPTHRRHRLVLPTALYGGTGTTVMDAQTQGRARITVPAGTSTVETAFL